MNLEDIHLTEEDFNMMIEAIEYLPEKGQMGLMMASLTGKLMAGNDPRAQAAVEKTIKKHEDELEAKKKSRAEDLAILKSKLILLKRFLITNGALAAAQKIVNNG